MLGHVVYTMARFVGLPSFIRRIRSGAPILCFHDVISGEGLSPTFEGPQVHWDRALHMMVEEFERRVQWIQRSFDLVGLDELLERMSSARPIRGLASLTFDDGYAGFFNHALPVLRSLGIPSTVFLVSRAHQTATPYWWDHPDLVARATPQRRHSWLTTGQGAIATILAMEGLGAPSALPPDFLPASTAHIRSLLGPDLTIGAHTATHPCLTTLTDERLATELEDGAAQLERTIGFRPRYLAYPYGIWNSRVRAAAQAAGYDACLTLEPVWTNRTADRGALPRINIPGGMTDAAFESWVSGLRPAVRHRS